MPNYLKRNFVCAAVVLVVLALVAMLRAEQPKRSPSKTSPLAQCQAERASRDTTIQQLTEANAKLSATNSELESKSYDLQKKDSEIRAAAFEVMQNDQQFSGDYRKLVDAYNVLLAQHNQLIGQATEYFREQSDARRRAQWNAIYQTLERDKQQRTNNLYVPPPPPRTFNCTTNQVGNQSYTTCR